MIKNSRVQVAWVALGFYLSFLFFWTLSHELSDMRATRFPLYFDWESNIVFQGWALPLYFSLDIAVIVFPFYYRSWRNAIAPVGTILIQTAIAAIFFVLVPIEPGYETTGVWGPYFYEYFSLDNLSRWNHAPSLHVAFAYSLAWFVGNQNSIRLILCMLWATGVSISTMLVHEHHLICVLGGFALFVFTIVTVYPALQRKFNDPNPCTMFDCST